MKWDSITITRKITLIMSTIVLAILLLSVVAVYALTSTEETFSSLIDNETTMMQHVSASKLTLLRSRREEKDALYNDDASLIESIHKHADNMNKEGKIMSTLVVNTNDADMIKLVGAITKNFEKYKRFFTSTVAAEVGQPRMRAAIPMRRAANKVEKQLDNLTKSLGQRIQTVKKAALQNATQMKIVVGVVSFIIILLGAVFALLLTVSIVGPLHKLQDRMITMAKGEFEEEVPFLTRQDEIGEMATAVQVFKDNGIETNKMRANERLKSAESEEAQKSLFAQTEKFSDVMAVIIDTISSASDKMQSTAGSLTTTADATSQKAGLASSATEEASSNVQTVASAAEELSSSVKEISQQVSRSSDVARSGVEKAEQTDKLVTGLAETAQRIGDVVQLINDIASQTNLLALNATIEAARAGDAGKGFAVVASEVKNLASQTGKATEDITEQINAVQEATKEAVTAIQDISGTIRQSSEFASAIAAAVEEQGAATNEIAGNAQQASVRTTEASVNVGGVTQAAEETGTAANMVKEVANDLAKQSNDLRREVESFIAGVRTTKA